MIELAPQHKFGLPLSNPVMPASGVLGYATEYADLVAFELLGALVTNPVSLRPRQTATGTRLGTRDDHLVVHTGLPNPGVRVILREYGRIWEHLSVPVIVHVVATTPDETAHVAEDLAASGVVHGIELGLAENTTARKALDLLDSARTGGLPVIARVPFSRVDGLAPVLVRAAVDALTLTAPPRAVVPLASLPQTDVVRYLRGRLYGPALFPMLLNNLAHWARKLEVPVIACGGIRSFEDALACLSLGAAAVQIDAVIWRDPDCLNRIARAFREKGAPAPVDDAEPEEE